MRKVQYWIAVVLVASTALIAVVAQAAPRLDVDEPAFDFGSVLEGETVTHSFVLTNTGDALLVIQQARASCGCTATFLSKKTLAPGESLALETSLRTNGYGGRTINKTVVVKSNDPDDPEVILSLTGTVLEGNPYGIPAQDLRDSFYLLLDLRQPEDYASGHLMGAINIPYDELDSWITSLPHRLTIILYDQDGSLSDLAAKILANAGFPEAKSLIGGIDQWNKLYNQEYVVLFKLLKP